MKQADIILKGNAIFTGLEDRPVSGAIAVSGNKIQKVFQIGESPDAYVGPDTKVIDAGDKLIMPGLIDAHTHFFMGATCASSHCCMEITDSVSETDCVRIIKEYADTHPDEACVLGMGWLPAFWNDAPLPTKKSLDEAIPDRPVYLAAADVHTVWTNSKGLEELGIDRNSTVSSGEIPKDADGEPTGLLIEFEACLPAIQKLYDFPKEVLKEIYSDLLTSIAKNGITAFGEVTPSFLNQTTYNQFDALAEFERDGKLTARLHLYSDLLSIDSDAAKELKTANRYHSDKLVYTGLKTLLDGVTSTYTGFLLEPYADKPDTVGYANAPKADYEKATAIANRAGLPMRCHCIGDAAVRWGLDIFEHANAETGNPKNTKKIRNTIEHIESIQPEDIPRFKELGVIASVQPAHLVLDENEKISRIGKARSRWEWPFRTLLDQGAHLAFGTDYPVVGLNPFKNIYAAVTRCNYDGTPAGVNPEERISLSEALKRYTAGSAYVFSRESELGTLEEGKLADIIVVNKNLFEIPEIDILKAEVDLTIFDGKEIYKKES
ncbi:MAG: amidohydrolase [Clostridiales Family XIII bacterium]|jgi:predicted amidohydrolase YtcJ|nr:amidohydrolase [Clostridiales Family XIII bacterium]